MPLPTTPPRANNAAGCIVAMLKSYFSVVRTFGQLLLLGPREAFMVGTYSQLLKQAPPNDIIEHASELLPKLRELVLQSIIRPDGKPPDTEMLIRFESYMHSFARWQAAWALFWCAVLPGSYFVWLLVISTPTMREADAIGIISALVAILLMTVILAMVCFFIWNILRNPFARLCRRFYVRPDLLEFLEPSQEET